MSGATIPRVGTQMAGYRISGLIGRGGMSVVYLAEHIRLGRKVALKILAPELAEDEAFRERFVRESQMASQLDHPNVIPIFEADEADGLLFIAMRYVDGMDLKALIMQEGAIAPERAMGIIAQVGGALDAAHGAGLVHRDVKPANILVTPVGRSGTEHVYLSDFGLVKHTISRSGITRTGQFVGTLDYVSPEQVQGNPVDHRADIYALGCVLYETLTGRVPYPRDGDAAVMWAHVWEPPPSARAQQPDVPRALDRVVAKAMAKSPAERYQSADELTNDGRLALVAASAGEDPQATVDEVAPMTSDAGAGAQTPTVTDAEEVRTSGPFVPPEHYPPPPPDTGTTTGSGDHRAPTPWFRHPAAIAGGVALAVLLVIGGAALLLGGEEQPPPDTRPPDTAISGDHQSVVQEGESLVIAFTSTESGSAFACSVDDGQPTGCTSPHTVTPLPPGEHSVTIAATDRAGNIDPTPVTHHFTVEQVVGDTLIDHVPTAEFSTPCQPRTDNLPQGTVEALFCSEGNLQATYFLFGSRASLDRYYNDEIQYYGDPGGDCFQFQPGSSEWGYQEDLTVSAGDIVCGTTDLGFTAVESSLWDENIYVEAIPVGREDQPLEETMAFWDRVKPF